jgi:dolichol kinase
MNGLSAKSNATAALRAVWLKLARLKQIYSSPTADLATRELLLKKAAHLLFAILAWPLMLMNQAALVALLVLLSGVVLLLKHRFTSGFLALLILAVTANRSAMVGAWVVLAVGDGVSATAGRLMGGSLVFRQGDKTWAGTLGFAVSAALALWAFLSFSTPVRPTVNLIIMSIATALIGATIEAAVLRGDDNFAVTLASGVTLELVGRLL